MRDIPISELHNNVSIATLSSFYFYYYCCRGARCYVFVDYRICFSPFAYVCFPSLSLSFILSLPISLSFGFYLCTTRFIFGFRLFFFIFWLARVVPRLVQLLIQFTLQSI